MLGQYFYKGNIFAEDHFTPFSKWYLHELYNLSDAYTRMLCVRQKAIDNLLRSRAGPRDKLGRPRDGTY